MKALELLRFKERVKNVNKAINKAVNIFLVFGVILALWMFLSFIEVNTKNTMENPTYNEYNFFVLLTESRK